MPKPTMLYGNALISHSHSVTTDLKQLAVFLGIIEWYCECVENCHNGRSADDRQLPQ
jgi:hypothetical protein